MTKSSIVLVLLVAFSTQEPPWGWSLFSLSLDPLSTVHQTALGRGDGPSAHCNCSGQLDRDLMIQNNCEGPVTCNGDGEFRVCSCSKKGTGF